MTENTALTALNIAKHHRNGTEDGPVTLSTGVRAILKPVPSATVEEAQSKIKTPSVPITATDDGRELENPNDPDYVRALGEVRQARIRAGFDVMAALCVELVDPLPPAEQWLKRLRMLERRGHIDLSGFDLDDEIDREFVYIRYVALANDDWQLLSKISGVTEEAIQRAMDGF